MTLPKPLRWLQVAQRASEFRTLLGSAELAEVRRVCDQTELELRTRQDLRLQAQQAWRQQMAQPLFHAGDDLQHRRFQSRLKESIAQQMAQVDQAREQLGQVQQSLRRDLAERDALQLAIEQVQRSAQALQAQAGQREADEVWLNAQYRQGGAV